MPPNTFIAKQFLVATANVATTPVAGIKGVGSNLHIKSESNTNIALMPGGSGGVGVGTATPAYKLDVYGGNSRAYNATASVSNIVQTGLSTTGFAQVQLVNPAGTWSMVNFGSGTFSLYNVSDRLTISSTGAVQIPGTLSVTGAVTAGSFIGGDFWIAKDFAWDSTYPLAIVTAPDGYVIRDVLVQVTTTFDSTDPSITVGDAGDVDGFAKTIDGSTSGYYGATGNGFKGAYLNNGGTRILKWYAASTAVNIYHDTTSALQGAGTVYLHVSRLK